MRQKLLKAVSVTALVGLTGCQQELTTSQAEFTAVSVRFATPPESGTFATDPGDSETKLVGHWANDGHAKQSSDAESATWQPDRFNVALWGGEFLLNALGLSGSFELLWEVFGTRSQ